MGVLTDTTYRIKAEEALRLSEEKYRLLVENANDAIFILQDGKIKFFNDKAKLIGIELGIDLDRVSFHQYIYPKDRDMVIDRHIRRLKGETFPDTYAFRLIGENSQEMWVEINAVKLTWQGKPATLNFLRDITFQRKLEQQLQLSQKMEAVGTLAGGVAHDFNNLLMAIQGRNSLMMLETDHFHPSFEHLQEIENCIQKAAKLTKQLLGFARGGKYEIKPTNLNDLVENSAQMFGRTKKEITIYKKYEEKLWPAAVDQSQIDQVSGRPCLKEVAFISRQKMKFSMRILFKHLGKRQGKRERDRAWPIICLWNHQKSRGAPLMSISRHLKSLLLKNRGMNKKYQSVQKRFC
jgi:PAS domain S-box-containing protein